MIWEEHRFNEVGSLLLIELLKLGCGYVDFTVLLFVLLCMFKNALGLPGGTCGKDLTCQCRRWKTHGCSPWVGKIPWRQGWQPTPGFLPGESHRQRGLADYSP